MDSMPHGETSLLLQSPILGKRAIID